MTRRYYVPDLALAGGLIELPDTEAQHATRVMRVQPGDCITLFDGKGHEAPATVETVSRHDCYCQAMPAEKVTRTPSRLLHLGIALPKSDRARELIERLTELGVHSVTPLISQRTQRPPSKSLLDKLHRGSIEACKQSGRNVLLQINRPQTTQQFFAAIEPDATRWIADPGGSPLSSVFAHVPDRVVVAIGPEGGWSEPEVDQALESGFKAVGFGPRIFRIATAAVYVAARLL